MKRILITLILIIGFANVNAQTIEYNADLMSSVFLQDGMFSPWTGWEEVNSTIVFDKSNMEIMLYEFDGNTQSFYVNHVYAPEEDDDGDIVYSFSVVDEQGVSLEVRMIMYVSMDDDLQIYFIYPHKKIAYAVEANRVKTKRK